MTLTLFQVLEAARASGTFIPTLCAHPSIPARGTCRVCMVDIEGERKLQPACVTKVREGMKVHTHTQAVLDNIRFVLQLLRSKHPDTCATCDADGQCTFQDLLYRFQVRVLHHASMLSCTLAHRGLQQAGHDGDENTVSGGGCHASGRPSQICALA